MRIAASCLLVSLRFLATVFWLDSGAAVLEARVGVGRFAPGRGAALVSAAAAMAELHRSP